MNIKRSIEIATAIKGTNKARLANDIGMSKQSMNSFLNSNSIKQDTINKIASTLGYSVSELIALGEKNG